MLSVNAIWPILPIKDSYKKNSVPKSSLQSKHQFNMHKDTFTKKISFCSLSMNPEINILPNLKLAMKNSLTGIYKQTTKKGMDIEIKVLGGKKINEIHADKTGNITVSGFRYNENGKLTQSVTNQFDKVSIERYFNDKEQMTFEVVKKLNNYSYERYFNEDQKVVTKLIKNPEGKTISVIEYSYLENGKLEEKVTKFRDGTTIIQKYTTHRRASETEVTRNKMSDKKIFEGENNHQVQQFQRMGDGSEYVTDYWPNGEIKSYLAKHLGLVYSEARSTNGNRIYSTRQYQGNTYTLFANNDNTITNGLFRTKEGEVYNVMFDEESCFTDLVDKNGANADKKILTDWFKSFEYIEKEIFKFEFFKQPDAVTDSYQDILIKHFEAPIKREIIPFQVRPMLSKVNIKNKYLESLKLNNTFTKAEIKNKTRKKIITNEAEFLNLHCN